MAAITARSVFDRKKLSLSLTDRKIAKHARYSINWDFIDLKVSIAAPA
jgi:hypothetical protein